jgi:hypothetical protein
MNPIAKNAVVHIKRVDFLNVEIDDDDLVPQHHVIVLYRTYLHLVQRFFGECLLIYFCCRYRYCLLVLLALADSLTSVTLT